MLWFQNKLHVDIAVCVNKQQVYVTKVSCGHVDRKFVFEPKFSILLTEFSNSHTFWGFIANIVKLIMCNDVPGYHMKIWKFFTYSDVDGNVVVTGGGVERVASQFSFKFLFVDLCCAVCLK